MVGKLIFKNYIVNCDLELKLNYLAKTPGFKPNFRITSLLLS